MLMHSVLLHGEDAQKSVGVQISTVSELTYDPKSGLYTGPPTKYTDDADADMRSGERGMERAGKTAHLSVVVLYTVTLRVEVVNTTDAPRTAPPLKYTLSTP